MRLQLDSASVGAGGVGSSDRVGPGDVAAVAAAGSAGNSARGGGPSASDSPDSSSVSATSSLLNSLSADRAARIQQLTDLVQSGSYQVSSAAVSGALVGQAIA